MTAVPSELAPGEDTRFPDPVDLVSLNRGQLVDYELNVAPGAAATEVAATLAAVPGGALFMDHYGDVDVTLVFRQIVPPQ